MDHNGVVVNTSDFHSSNRRSFPGRREYNLLFNVDIVSLLLKNNGGGRDRRPQFLILLLWNTLIIGELVIVAWDTKSYLGPAEISFFVYLV